eukprot:UN06057
MSQKKFLRQMGLKLATDKYIWIMLLLVCMAIVAVFYYSQIMGYGMICYQFNLYGLMPL